MRLERDHRASFSDQLGQQAREDATVRTDFSTGPTGLDEPGDGRLELRLVRPVALSEPSENRAHRGAIVTVNLRFALSGNHAPINAWTEEELALLERDFRETYADRTVLVTGADGFMGSHLTEALVHLGANVNAFVRATSSGALNNIGHLRRQLKVHFADLTDRASVDYLSPNSATRPTGRTSSISARRRTSASPGTGPTKR